jgi:hypothetical protein
MVSRARQRYKKIIIWNCQNEKFYNEHEIGDVINGIMHDIKTWCGTESITCNNKIKGWCPYNLYLHNPMESH